MKIQRTITYIDGFNLYFGLREKGWRCYYWLNLWTLCNSLTLPNQQLIKVKYFTSRIRKPDDKRKRQNSYLRALRTIGGIECIYGKYIDEPHTCPNCNKDFLEPAEKMTDVQLASFLIRDVFKDMFDTAIIISGDRDLVPAVEICNGELPKKRIVIAFPPMRSCEELRCLGPYIHITEKQLQCSVFPNEINHDGLTIQCPPSWH